MKDWDAGFTNRSPMFEPLRVYGAGLSGRDWPGLAELQAAINARGIVSGGGKPLHLVPPNDRAAIPDARYEMRIYREGELEVRESNWHDLFNVLAWITFPRAKTALNMRHYQALRDQPPRSAGNRGPAQDALTLFDESGMVVVSSEPELLQDVRDFGWKRLFWERRERVVKHMRWLLFGHGLYEKALQPFVGMTGHGLLLEVDRSFHALTMMKQLDVIDDMLARRIADTVAFCTTREFAPVPLLGVPGWWPANTQPAFYDNAAYFRTGRRGK